MITAHILKSAYGGKEVN